MAVKQIAKCLDNFSCGEAAVLAGLDSVVDFLNNQLSYMVNITYVLNTLHHTGIWKIFLLKIKMLTSTRLV